MQGRFDYQDTRQEERDRFGGLLRFVAPTRRSDTSAAASAAR